MMIWYVSSHGGVMAKKTPKQKINTSPSGTTMRTKRNTKDSVFTHLFSFPEYQLKMYQALHPEDTEVNAAIRSASAATKTYSPSMSKKWRMKS